MPDDALTPRALIQRYAATFHDALRAIARLVEPPTGGVAPAAQPEAGAVVAKLAALRQGLTEASAYLPPYDQRIYELKIKELEAKHRARLAAAASSPVGGSGLDPAGGDARPKKFAFRRQAPASSSAPRSAAEAGDATAVGEQRLPAPTPTPAVKGEGAGEGTEPRPLDAPSTGLSLSDRSSAFLTPASLPPAPHGPIPGPPVTAGALQSLTLSGLSGCLLDLRELADRLSALRIDDVSGSALVLGWVEGSVVVNRWRQSAGAFGARQLRVHDSSELELYLYTKSQPVIERSDSVSVAAYPTDPASNFFPSLPLHLTVCPPPRLLRPFPLRLSPLGVETASPVLARKADEVATGRPVEGLKPSASRHAEVQDFDHPAGGSPNWRLASPAGSAAGLRKLAAALCPPARPAEEEAAEVQTALGRLFGAAA